MNQLFWRFSQQMFDESLISLITDKCERLNKLTQLIIGDYKSP